MDAKRLMIGDYIQFSRKHSSPLPPKPVQVFGIDYDGEIYHRHLLDIVFCESGTVQYNYNPDIFEPIPITKDFLEKNNLGRDGRFGIYDEYYDLTIREVSDGIWVFRYECTEMDVPYTQDVISYVHELQQALRRHEIDIEIRP